MRSLLLIIVSVLAFNLAAMEVSCEIDREQHRITINLDNLVSQKMFKYSSVALVEQYNFKHELTHRAFTTAMHYQRECSGCLQVHVDRIDARESSETAHYQFGFVVYKTNKSPELYESYYQKDFKSGPRPVRCFSDKEGIE